MAASPIELSVTSARSFSSNRASAFAARDHAVHGLGQQVGVESGFQQVVLGATLDRELPDLLMVRVA
jgi:hypothetical protein